MESDQTSNKQVASYCQTNTGAVDVGSQSELCLVNRETQTTGVPTTWVDCESISGSICDDSDRQPTAGNKETQTTWNHIEWKDYEETYRHPDRAALPMFILQHLSTFRDAIKVAGKDPPFEYFKQNTSSE